MHRITAGFGGLMIADEDTVVAQMEDMLAVVRATGALGWVPYTLNVLAVARLLRGEFAHARAVGAPPPVADAGRRLAGHQSR